MIYYGCSFDQLAEETSRRGFHPAAGTHDGLSEGLRSLDDNKRSKATTVETVFTNEQYNPIETYTTLSKGIDGRLRMVRKKRLRKSFGTGFDASQLVGQRLTFWTINTFAPVMQLFFESGLSCNIEGAQLSGSVVEMDDTLRNRLADLMHEEEGQLFKTTLPEKFLGVRPAVKILDAKVARRTSVAVKQLGRTACHHSSQPTATIVHEHHMVVGLQLEGMTEMGYVWASVTDELINYGRSKWGNVRLAGLVDDVYMPFIGFPQTDAKPGAQITVVERGSLIRRRRKKFI